MNTGRKTGAVILLSGGLDSTVLLHYLRHKLRRRVTALSVAYGQKHSRELRQSRIQAMSAGVVEHVVADMRFIGPLLKGSALTDDSVAVPALAGLNKAQLAQPPTYVPNRNMMLLSIAAAFAESRGICEIYYGAHQGDRYSYWDCSSEFVRRLNRALALNRKDPVSVIAPFTNKSKAEILRIGMRLGVDFSRTWSCYRGGACPCGECPTCVERAAAFACAGIADPLIK